jgi:hypothetical protein
LPALSNLGTLRFHQGRLQEAADLYERSLVGFEAALGTAHRLLLRPLNNLARVRIFGKATIASRNPDWRRITPFDWPVFLCHD